ncbi:hypothetical protein J6590_044443 [Homalodisca vitripennis]|nr:hypothetical protein J6590_044443 [Homalodisca vitripennis]
MGDFNVDALNKNHPSTKRLIDLLRSFDLELLVKSSTRVTANTQSAIDNIITNISDVAVYVVNSAISAYYGQEDIIRDSYNCTSSDLGKSRNKRRSFRDSIFQRQNGLTDAPNQRQTNANFLNKNSLWLLHQNAQFATNKLDKLQLVCEEHNTDILVVTENGFKNKNIELCKIPNFGLPLIADKYPKEGESRFVFKSNKFKFTVFQSRKQWKKCLKQLESESPNERDGVFFSKLECILTDLTNLQLNYVLMVNFNVDALNNTHLRLGVVG